MAQIASPLADKTTRQPNDAELVPPDEQFWQRYSPHAEFPLSSAGSLAIHLLILGLLVLMAWLGAILFGHATRTLPVEAVRLDLGGGGGNPHGTGTGPNKGAAPVEAGGDHPEGTADNPPTEDVERPKKLDINPTPSTTPKFDSATRYIQELDNDHAQSFQRLRDVTKNIRVPDSKPSGYGQGGTGEGGGSGEGKGTGVGNATGEGRGTLTQREKRMLRWSMLFNTNTGQDYVGQLRGLGAILAIPVREDASGRDYEIVRDLSARPARLVKEDISSIQRIYWIDDKPQSIRDVLNVLGIHLPTLPSHFVAFMPEELEQKLYDLEKAYLKKHYPGRAEESITETRFRINVRGGKYEPEVIGLKLKR